jgi:hypothetical protein
MIGSASARPAGLQLSRGVLQLPYRLPELKDAIAIGSAILLVEGKERLTFRDNDEPDDVL